MFYCMHADLACNLALFFSILPGFSLNNRFIIPSYMLLTTKYSLKRNLISCCHAVSTYGFYFYYITIHIKRNSWNPATEILNAV